MVTQREWLEYKFKILWNLASSRKWGSSYTPIKNVSGGLPGDKIGYCLSVAEDLIKDRLLIPHKKGKCVSLNHRRKREILEFLDEFE